MKSRNALLALLMVFLCSGCASIFSGTRQKITVNSTPSGAKLSVIDHEGATILQTNTPAVIKLERGKGYFAGSEFKLQLEADGYAPSTTNIQSGLNGLYIGNILFGGIIGFVFVDPATGAMWSLKPDVVNVTLEASPGKAAVLGTGINTARNLPAP